ncbi:MAG TPA: glycosyltransferase [Actinoplanes sp.]
MSVVIPVRDAAGLPPMLRTLPAADEVIVVIAAPVPDAAVRAACPGAILVRQTRSGLGNALACGVAASTGDIVVTLDGDGATDPGELQRYVDALMAGADMAAGSRYRDGGRDLTTGRFRRGLNVTLVWLLNVLYGVRRTDPGFGYHAFWRDALDRLALPDPSATLPVRGDGPEIEALLAVRAAARGLRVTEVPGVAYPRMRRASRADRTTVRHWLRALLTEFPGRTARPPRHSAAPPGTAEPQPERGALPDRRVPLSDHRVPLPDYRVPLSDRGVPLSDRRFAAADSASDAAVHSGGLSTGAPHDLRFSARIETGGGPRRARKDQAGKDQAGKDQAGKNQAGKNQVGKDPVEPIWGPPRRSPGPADLWLANIPAPLDRPARPLPPMPDRPVIASVPVARTRDVGRVTGRRRDDRRGEPASDTGARQQEQAAEPRREAGTQETEQAGLPRSEADTRQTEQAAEPRSEADTRETEQAEPHREADARETEQAAEPRREVGARRRHLEGYRQRPELRVINGEGAGGGRSRSGRLRAVPPRETTGGLSGPQ